MTKPGDNNSNKPEKRLLDEGMAALRGGQWLEAEQLFKEFLEKYPRTDLSDNAHYNLATVYREMGNKEQALAHLQIVVEEFPDSDACYFAKDELEELLREMGIGPAETASECYKRGTTAYAEGALDEALAVFQQFLDKYPKSDLIDNAHYNLAKIYHRRGDHAKVRHHVQVIMTQYPESDAATYAEELLDEDLGDPDKPTTEK